MAAGNGTKIPTAAARARTVERQATKDEATLAAQFGQVVGQILVELLPQMLAPLRAQRDACLVCCVQRKTLERAHAELARLATEAEQAAGEAGQPVPEMPALPPIPDVQESCTTAPIVLRADMPAVPAPVCYDHLPASGAEAGLPPVERDTGLVGADGRPIVAQSR